MSYDPKMAAALTGATLRQLAHWRNATNRHGAVLIPEVSPARPILYSFRDLVALRTCVQMREEVSLQKIRRALDTLRHGLGEREHLSAYTLVAEPKKVYLVADDHAVDLLRGGNVVIHQMVDVLRPFYHDGRKIPDLFEPRQHLRLVAGVRGGEPVVEGTRIPATEVAALVRDGIAPEDISQFYPGVSAEAALDAVDFADYVDSYTKRPHRRQAAS